VSTRPAAAAPATRAAAPAATVPAPRAVAGGGLPGRAPLRLGPVSTVWRPRAAAVAAVLVPVLAVAVAAHVALGELPLSPVEVLGVLAGGGSGAERFVVLELRLPRAVTGVLVGAALGLSGALTQSVLRNPLASPDLLGVTSGAAAAAVALLVLRDAAPLPAVSTPVAAVLGGLATSAAIYLLAWRRGVQGSRLVLVGIGAAALLQAVTSWLLVRADLTDAARATAWLTGSLNARSWEHAAPLAGLLAAAALVLVAATPLVGVLRLGDDTVRGLGVRLQGGQAVLLLVAVVLASAAVAAAGPVAFVALVAPQLALRLLRSAGPPPAASALVGAVLVVTADLVARALLPAGLPVGIVTALLGAPFLLHLLVRRAREVTA